MKELSIEEKAKRYDEAINVAEKYHNGTLKDVMETIFPELKESKDEGIRKEIIDYLKERKSCESYGQYVVRYDRWIAWLEKQGNLMGALQVANKEIGELVEENYYLKEKQGEQNPADKVKPKFKKGDVIRRKDGDGLEWTVEDLHKDGYYTIVNSDRDDFVYLDDNWELVEQKNAWSEDDSRILYNVKAYIGYAAGQRGVKDELFKEANEWLNSLPIGFICNKNYNEDMITLLVGELEQIANNNNAPLQYQAEINWLKSLRPQNRWKPSEEQIKALKEACDEHWEPDGLDPLYVLWEQLKKLREE